MIEIFTYFQQGKRLTEEAIATGLIDSLGTAHTMVTAGSLSQRIAGLLILIGLITIIKKGAWKIFAKLTIRNI